MASDSSIGEGTVVRGNLRGDGSIEIYGRVEGDVTVNGDVKLGNGAQVRGSIQGSRLEIDGTVAGDLRGEAALLLGPNAQVEGDLSSPRIGIEEGARVQGNVRTDGASGGGARRSAQLVEARREEPRRAQRTVAAAARRVEAEPTSAPAPRAAHPPPARVANPPPARSPNVAAQGKRPPAPVVPAVRRSRARKKKSRQR